MIKRYVHAAVVLFCAWNVYGYCQEDVLLPLGAAGIVTLSFLARLKSGEREFKILARFPLSLTIFLSFLAGWLWRQVFPAPETATSPFPVTTAALQAGAIFAAVLIWLKPYTKNHTYQLTFLAWLTVALSINVPFTPEILFMFSLFCVVALATVILNTTQKPREKKHIFRYYRDFIVFSVLLVTLTTGLFYLISKSIVLLDEAFTAIVSEYINPGHYTNFLNINSRLSLVPPGRSAWDRRPVLEVGIPGVDEVYLKTQVFKDFDNGVWQEETDILKRPLTQTLDPHLPHGKMLMFTPFKDIIPTFAGTAAIKGNGTFFKSDEDIVYAKDLQRTRALEFSLTNPHPISDWTPEKQRRYTAIPADIASDLSWISRQVAGRARNPWTKAQRIQNFFRSNFHYSLSAYFRADNRGIIRMILERRPAYCSYFATAMTLLLRAQGIPARVAVGFLTYEKVDRHRNMFLVRVNQAHAWSEVLLPRWDAQTGKMRYLWQKFDPTPPADREDAIRPPGINLRDIIEKGWLAMLRFGVYVDNLDKEKLKVRLLWTLLLFMFLANAKKIWRALPGLLRLLKKTAPAKKRKLDRVESLYRRYEIYLKSRFGEVRQPQDTDTEVVERLKQRTDVSPEKIIPLESFVDHYHAVRFGGKSTPELEKSLSALEKEARASQTH